MAGLRSGDRRERQRRGSTPVRRGERALWLEHDTDECEAAASDAHHGQHGDDGENDQPRRARPGRRGLGSRRSCTTAWVTSPTSGAADGERNVRREQRTASPRSCGRGQRDRDQPEGEDHAQARPARHGAHDASAGWPATDRDRSRPASILSGTLLYSIQGCANDVGVTRRPSRHAAITRLFASSEPQRPGSRSSPPPTGSSSRMAGRARACARSRPRRDRDRDPVRPLLLEASVAARGRQCLRRRRRRAGRSRGSARVQSDGARQPP